MGDSVNIVQEKSRTRAFMHAFAVFLMTYLCFWGLSAICFGILDVACRLGLIIHSDGLHVNWSNFFGQPLYIFELYAEWWRTLLKSMRLMNIRLVLLLPFVVPAGMVSTIFLLLLKQQYSFGLWYVLNHHFAKMEDINAMGLNKGVFMVLGRFADAILSVKPAESVLCIGEMGTGKTSSVAIPSVLHSDNASVIAVDMTGLLPKYTAGYRATLGDVVYYNWDLLDEPEKGIFYPRWNPLSAENMPHDTAEKESYLKRLAGYLVDVEDSEQDNYWNLLAHSVIAAFLGYWTAKVSQAQANDYFLGKLVEEHYLTRDEKDILLSYYIQMPQPYVKDAIAALENDLLDKDNYMPIGSWEGIPEQWIGKETCLAAITDWMISNYMTSHDEAVKDWRNWTESLLRESAFFGYGNIVANGLRQFLMLSQRQRQIAFACVMKPFRIFTNQAIRERTNGNDFNLESLRGTYDEKNKIWRPVTVYSLANTHSSKILNQMFLDEAMYRSLHLKENQGPLPVMLVLDDVGHNLRLKNLTELLTAGKAKKMSALLLCNSLSLVENTYSREELECLVTNTFCKIVKAPDNLRLSRQLDKLAAFATKSVQIPKERKGRRLRRKKYYANAEYFHQLALDFKLRKDIIVDTKDHQIILAEGYYNRPILADNIFFAEDERFKKLAVLDAEYGLSEEKMADKNKTERDTPKIAEVFDQTDLGVDDLVELDQYMNIVLEEVSFEIGKNMEKSEDTKASAETDKKENVSNKTDETEKDWWLEEDAFEVGEETAENPFVRKKTVL